MLAIPVSCVVMMHSGLVYISAIIKNGTIFFSLHVCEVFVRPFVQFKCVVCLLIAFWDLCTMNTILCILITLPLSNI